jgi:hypothetical protein
LEARRLDGYVEELYGFGRITGDLCAKTRDERVDCGELAIERVQEQDSVRTVVCRGG